MMHSFDRHFVVFLSRAIGQSGGPTLELVDAKVEEADTLKEKFEASQLELERFSAEYCILQDVLLQDCGEDLPAVENDFEQREFGAFQYLKKLLDSAKRKREALENQLAKKEEQFNLLQKNYQHDIASEEELKTQREQHVKATKELENEHCTALDEAAKCEVALSALKTDYSQQLDKYNHIVYRHRSLQEEFHAAAQEKRSLEDRCAQLTEEWATARRALAVFEEQQGAVGQKTTQELQELRQANQQLQERFRLLKDKHLKAEERLVQAPNQKVGASMEHVTEGTGDTARTSEAPVSRVEIEELSRRPISTNYSASVSDKRDLKKIFFNKPLSRKSLKL
ncbi:hypothetical protein HPB47_001437 [Ixodes persulcatus]|uniref:Uncharacterized protein n=1 Tax=Ixodes persulcatus TaxID=34615 RepID=A0AC60PP11_IXOPE|nr:hypothetical protein HPB47_001437 [Ixodes persulcatus]